MAERFYCGVDGGGSRTRVALFDAGGRRVGLVEAGPTSLTLRGAGAWPVIRDALRDLCIAAELPPDNLAAIHFGIGLAGANDAAQRARFIEAAPEVGGLRVATDAYIAALGAHRGAPGAIVIVGTGSVGYRFEPGGRSRLVGGWGFPVGDEGSGAWLGRAALAQALQVLERRYAGRATELHAELIDRCGTTPDAVMAWLRGADSTRFATLAPIVIDGAGRGDAAALQLVGAAGREIDALAEALDPARAVPLALVGGLAQPLAPYLPASLQSWVQEPFDDPVAGALLLARGEAPDETLIRGGDLA